MSKKAKHIRAQADISVPLFKIAARFCSREAARKAISGVRIERHPQGGVALIGTDGHRMIIIRDERGRCARPFTLEAKRGLKLARRHDVSTATSETRWRVSSVTRKGWQRVPTIEAEFPNWRSIPANVAPTRGGAVHSVNARYVADFARVAVELGGKFPRVNWIAGKDAEDPVLFVFPSSPHVCGVLMPMMKADGKRLPAFVHAMLGPKRKST